MVAKASTETRRRLMNKESFRVQTQAYYSLKAPPELPTRAPLVVRPQPRQVGRPTGLRKAGSAAGQQSLPWAQPTVTDGEEMEE
jgi:hypothetical protein